MELENVIVPIGSRRHRGLIKVSSNGDCDRVISSQRWIIHINLIIMIITMIIDIIVMIIIKFSSKVDGDQIVSSPHSMERWIEKENSVKRKYNFSTIAFNVESLIEVGRRIRVVNVEENLMVGRVNHHLIITIVNVIIAIIIKIIIMILIFEGRWGDGGQSQLSEL